ncbi:NAD(P)/FAD-dependent oxidoreductase [Streptomyces blattellae]|uniref:NAD(P)/FAD-dependent oxidoreductase n=1 Tax=Streptomyces blattellae TaxID=2569855 RepID=UPI001E5455A5|nr:FAD-dependent oxidoreductase [Streptomyces blattellae]
MTRVVVVGAGHGGVATAQALRAAGSTAHVTLVSAEDEPPYERPPLSKDVLLGKASMDSVRLRAAGWYDDNGVDLLLGTRVAAIDREARAVHLDGGAPLPYDALVLATGGRPRPLPCPGSGLAGVCSLLTSEHCRDLRSRLAGARDVVIVGAGFIGLEVASAAVALGLRPVVLELVDRVLARGAAAEVSRAVASYHLSRGVDLRLGTGVRQLLGTEERVTGVVTSTGEVLPADLVLVGVGSSPNDGLAAEAGLHCQDGVVVDAGLRTTDPRISAIGDCARFPLGHGLVRLESVQNAVDQGKHVAARLAGTVRADAPYLAVPWFWSNQGGLRFQAVGVAEGSDHEVVRGDPEAGRFSVFRFRRDRLVCVDSVNDAAGHRTGRRLLANRAHPTLDQVADPSVDLRTVGRAPG